MDLGLKDKVVIVTGASRGIGKAIALGFAAEGARLSICGRTPETLEGAANEIKALGAEVFAKPTDVSKGADVEGFVKETLDRYGRIDGLVNNVGGSRWTPTLDISDQEWHDILDLNLVSAARMSRAVIPTMQKGGG
ncbi:SDR family NAD(P)-dependent oxidoreductase, partial [Candidatus Poribacteria bacterium]|nr:SDR family NAD(P)-dependent oxidoreductase [Candidatus Poribacteria bacterium]